MLSEFRTQGDRPLRAHSREPPDVARYAEAEWNGRHHGHQGGEEGSPLFNGCGLCFARKKKILETFHRNESTLNAWTVHLKTVKMVRIEGHKPK